MGGAHDVTPQLALDLGSLGESALYHDAGAPGFFSVLQKHGTGRDAKTSQSSHRLSVMPEVLRALRKDRDSWISQAEFIRANRRLVNIARIGLSFSDLDTYAEESKYSHLRPPDQCHALLDYCRQEGKPRPSLILFSGRGLQAKWFFTNPIPRQALPRWNAVQRAIWESLKPFGADPKARDGSRVLRIAETVNTKSGEIARVIWHDPTAVYDFDTFADEWLPYTREEIQAFRDSRAERQSQQAVQRALRVINGSKHGLRKLNGAQLNWDRLHDLRKLAELRNWERGAPAGMQDTALWLSSAFIVHAVQPTHLGLELGALAREFAPDWTMPEVRRVVSTTMAKAKAAANREKVFWNGKLIDPRYTFRNQRLIEYLEIEPSEEKQLKTIISKGEAAERHRVRNRKESDRATYLAQAEQRRQQAQRLKSQGLSYRQIAEAMDITRNAARELTRHG